MLRVSRLDVYLAATMQRGDRLSEMLLVAGLTAPTLEAERQAARAAGFFDPSAVTARRIESYFGPPTVRTAEALEYKLGLWPDHFFRWGLRPQGHAFHGGFVLNEPQFASQWIEQGSSSALGALRPWYHTQLEVRELLGEPVVDQGWGSSYEWLYEFEEEARDLMCLFDYGLLADVVRQAGLLKADRQRNPEP
jgi:hypothetical protein